MQGFTTILNAASALQESHLGDYQITNETVGFSADALRELQENESVQSVAAIQFSLYEQNEAGKPDGIDIGFALKPGETFQVIGLNDEYWDYFMGSELSADQLEELKSGNACVVRNPISVSYGEEPLEFTSLYKTFLWEGAYYGITASVIGSILGYICTIFIEAATSDTIQLVAIPVVSILEATLLAVGACLLATAIPLRKISNMSIVDSIETIE